jgi:hypothetical protein
VEEIDVDHMLSTVQSEVFESLGYSGETSVLEENRARILSGYLCEPYGDEVQGRSKVISSDIFTAVESILPLQLKTFTQSRDTARFYPSSERYRDEAEQKQLLANYVFSTLHDPVDLMMHQLKDAHLGYVGVLEVYWSEDEVPREIRQQVTVDELVAIAIQEPDLLDTAELVELGPGVFEMRAQRTEVVREARVEKVPNNEFLISKRARSINDTPLIGKRTRKTRSQLIDMGFDHDQVMALGGQAPLTDEVDSVRQRDYEGQVDLNPSQDPMNDLIELITVYVWLDATGKGKPSRRWLVHYAANEILGYELIMDDFQPFCAYIPIPIPNRAIGTCIGAQLVEYQYWKTAMLRHLSDMVYATLNPRLLANDLVELDDLLSNEIGQVCRVEGSAIPGNTVHPLVIPNDTESLLAVIELINQQIERRTGLSAVGQGFSFDSESLNATATGFRGQLQASQMRIELMNRIYADTALQPLFEKIIYLYGVHADGEMVVSVGGEEIQIDPSSWMDKSRCRIELGTGDSDRQQEVLAITNVITEQKSLLELGSPLVDQAKLYSSYKALLRATGLQDIELYFNNPERPEDLVLAENEQLKGQNAQLTQAVQEIQAQAQDQLVKAEKIKQQTDVAKLQMDAQAEQAKLTSQVQEARDDLEYKYSELAAKVKQDREKLEQSDKEFKAELSVKLAEIELKYDQEVNNAIPFQRSNQGGQ